MFTARNVLTFAIIAMLAGCSFRCADGKLTFVGPKGNCQEECQRSFMACKESAEDGDQEGLNQCQKWFNECVAKCEKPN